MKFMKKKNRNQLVFGLGLAFISFFLSSCHQMVLFDSKGPIGEQEAFLLNMAFLLMLIVVIPVFVMVLWFSLRYRASNTRATYKPKWAHSTQIEWAIWFIPIAIIVVLSYLTWTSTYELDPYKPIESTVKPIHVEVVSMDWNWLFIYPDYDIAVLNELVFPVNAPISFRLTSASVMTSFFIPQLGSQIYVMAGMQTKLNLLANEQGVYHGQNQEFSGLGYEGMYFDAKAVSNDQFESWVQKIKQANDTLSQARFDQLAQPHLSYPVSYFSPVEKNLFDNLMGKYMDWMGEKTNMKSMEHNAMGMPSDTGHVVNSKNMEGR